MMKQFLFGLIFISISAATIFGQEKNFDASFERGVALANQSRFAEALAEFQNAEALLDSSRLSTSFQHRRVPLPA